MNSCENLLKRGAIILPVHSSKCSAGVSLLQPSYYAEKAQGSCRTHMVHTTLQCNPRPPVPHCLPPQRDLCSGSETSLGARTAEIT